MQDDVIYDDVVDDDFFEHLFDSHGDMGAVADVAVLDRTEEFGEDEEDAYDFSTDINENGFIVFSRPLTNDEVIQAYLSAEHIAKNQKWWIGALYNRAVDQCEALLLQRMTLNADDHRLAKIRECAWVERTIPVDYRYSSDQLSFSHHRIAMRLESLDLIKECLDAAYELGWSVDETRKIVKANVERNPGGFDPDISLKADDDADFDGDGDDHIDPPMAEPDLADELILPQAMQQSVALFFGDGFAMANANSTTKAQTMGCDALVGGSEWGDNNVLLVVKGAPSTWIEQALSQYEQDGTKRILLFTEVKPSANGFDQLWQFPVCILRKGMACIDANGNPYVANNYAVVYIGDGTGDTSFIQEFAQWGTVVSKLVLANS